MTTKTEEYVTRTEFSLFTSGLESWKNEVNERLGRIEDQLDGLAKRLEFHIEHTNMMLEGLNKMAGSTNSRIQMIVDMLKEK
ncbi:MAG: hypothetical protein OXO51_15535 [Gemmatimonadota bacterium]|nr:hypothetical protein [Gemmatimonadota bacterium]